MSTRKAQETANMCLTCTTATSGIPGSSPKSHWLRAALWSPTATAQAERHPRPAGGRRERGACGDSCGGGARAWTGTNSTHSLLRGWGLRETQDLPSLRWRPNPNPGQGSQGQGPEVLAGGSAAALRQRADVAGGGWRGDRSTGDRVLVSSQMRGLQVTGRWSSVKCMVCR